MAIGPARGSASGNLSRNQTQPTPAALTGKYVEIFKRVKVTVQPAIEPVSLDELKAWLRITVNDEDTLLTNLIVAARSEIEEYLRRKLITQTLVMTLDQWPFFDFPQWEGQIEAPVTALVSDAELKLWYPPLQNVGQVNIVYRDGSSAVYPATNYLVGTATLDDYGRLVLQSDATVVNNLQEINAVEITYDAGYGDDATDVPYAIRQAILNYAAWMYTNRGDCIDQKISYRRGETPLDVSGATGYLQQFRIERLVN